MFNKYGLLWALISFFLLTQAFGAVQDSLEEEARKIEGMVISPCCWNQPVSVHYSPAADEMRAEIRKMLAEGKSREEILQSYVAEYGERILSKPRAKGFNLMAYLLPLGFLIAGGAVAWVVINKLRPTAAVATAGSVGEAKLSKADSKYSKQLEKELWGE